MNPASTIRAISAFVLVPALAMFGQTAEQIGKEGSSYERLEDGEEFDISLPELLRRASRCSPHNSRFKKAAAAR